MLKTLFLFFFIYSIIACKIDDNRISSVIGQPSISDSVSPSVDTNIDLNLSSQYVDPLSTNNIINVLSNDISQKYIVESITPPSSGTIQISSNEKSLIFTPDSNFQGDIIIQFTVNRTGGVTTQESFTIQQGDCSGEKLTNLPFANSGDAGIDGSGLGKEFKICTGTQLQNISTQLDKYFILGRNIDLSDISEFTPISDATTNFSGNFEGQGYSIDNLQFSACSPYCGMFGVTSASAVLKNFHLKNISIVGKGGISSGALVSEHSGLIEYVSVRGSIVDASGIVGINNDSGIISRSWSEVSISELNPSFDTGGISGMNLGLVQDSYSIATINLPNSTYVGGIVGYNVSPGSINRSYFLGTLTGWYYIGGITGRNLLGSINSSFTSANTTGNHTSTLSFYYSLSVGGSSSGASNVYLDSAKTCTAITTCLAVGTGVPLSQFYSSSNAPLSSWDFTNIWISDGISLPTLRPPN